MKRGGVGLLGSVVEPRVLVAMHRSAISIAQTTGPNFRNRLQDSGGFSQDGGSREQAFDFLFGLRDLAGQQLEKLAGQVGASHDS